MLMQHTNEATELSRDAASFPTELSLILSSFLTRVNSSLTTLDAREVFWSNNDNDLVFSFDGVVILGKITH